MVAKGRVTRVLPGMQAGFVDIGLEKAAFLYVGDYLDDEGLLDGEDEDRRRRFRRGPRQVPRIETLLQEGQEIIVQVAKEPIGTKGARITSHLSIAGRHLVLTPWSKRVGVSRRIGSDRERRRLRDIVTRARPKDLGFIIRTAGEGTREADIEADVAYLSAVWEEIRAAQTGARAPATLYEELSLPLRAIRDFANGRTRRIVVDDPGDPREDAALPRPLRRRSQAEARPVHGRRPLFDHEGLEARIDENLGKKVWLKSGGYLIVDQSEALTAIDVNTGRYVGKRDLEETGPQDQPRGGAGGRAPAALPQPGRPDHHRPDRHGERGEPRQGLSRAPGGAAQRQGAHQHPEDLRARPGRDDAQAHARESGAAACASRAASARGAATCSPRRRSRTSCCARSARTCRASADARSRCRSRRASARCSRDPARRALAALSEQLGREIEVRTRPGLHQEQFEIEALDVGPAVPIPVPWLESREERAAAEVARRSAAEAERAAAAEEARLAAAAREAAEAAPARPLAGDRVRGRRGRPARRPGGRNRGGRAGRGGRSRVDRRRGVFAG
jgi:Rne/Rng family ribonuclease